MAYHQRAPKGLDVLLEETWRLYRAAVKPAVLAAGAGALLAHSLGQIIQIETGLASVIWAAVLTSIIVSSQSVVLPLVLLVREGQPVNTEVATAAGLRFAPRYFGTALGLGLLNSALAATIVGIPLVILLIVRFAMFGPAMIVEDLSIPDALRRSWGLVQARWWRTFGVYLVALVIGATPIVLAALIGIALGTLPSLALSTVAWAVSVPFTAIFALHLFEDYRSLETESADDDIFGPRPHNF